MDNRTRDIVCMLGRADSALSDLLWFGLGPTLIFINCRTKLTIMFDVPLVGLGGLGVTCLPQDSRFAGSNPTEVDEFFEDVKILSKSPPEGILSWGSRV